MLGTAQQRWCLQTATCVKHQTRAGPAPAQALLQHAWTVLPLISYMGSRTCLQHHSSTHRPVGSRRAPCKQLLQRLAEAKQPLLAILQLQMPAVAQARGMPADPGGRVEAVQHMQQQQAVVLQERMTAMMQVISAVGLLHVQQHWCCVM